MSGARAPCPERTMPARLGLDVDGPTTSLCRSVSSVTRAVRAQTVRDLPDEAVAA